MKVKEPEKVAAGIEAVFQSGKYVLHEMNAVRGMKALLTMNQKLGFDCPSCAWPDPDDDRSPIAEYCENGAKALADEATTKSIASDFFAVNSVKELSALDDYHLGQNGRIAQPVYLAANG